MKSCDYGDCSEKGENISRLSPEGFLVATGNKAYSFREAYQAIGAQVQDGTYECKTRHRHTHIGGIDNLALDKIKAKYPKCD